MTYGEIDKAKARFIKLAEERLGRKVSGLQKKLFEMLTLQLLDFLDVENDQIRDTTKNLTAYKVFDSVFKEWNDKEHMKVIEQLLEDLEKISEFNSKYYGVFDIKDTGFSKRRFRDLTKKAQERMLKTLGISGNKILRGGFIDSILEDNSIKNRVKQIFRQAVEGRVSYKDTLTTLKNVITDTGADGLLQKHYRLYVYDTYQRYDRIEANLYAKELKFDAALYAGTVIKKTRSFCKDRANKVFTREEIESWKDLDWGGKKEPYDPFTDMGGWNCRHRYRWIPNRIAAKRRKDLELKNGKLVKK